MLNINDKSSLYDKLDYSEHAKAFANMIKDTDLPLTIISGEFDCCKTTLMHLIASYLDSEYYKNYEDKITTQELKNDIEKFHNDELKFTSIFLDTWHFISSEDIGESIFEQIMYELIKIIKKGTGFGDETNLLIEKIKNLINDVKSSGVLKVTMQSTNIKTEDGGDIDFTKIGNNISYGNFKTSIEEVFKIITSKVGKLIIFIDGLDKLTEKQILGIILFIKKFLYIRGYMFVIGTDNKVLKEELEKLYWSEYINGKGKEGYKKYLEKVTDNIARHLLGGMRLAILIFFLLILLIKILAKLFVFFISK